MSFYEFRLEGFHTIHKRGNIADQDVVTFTVVINQADRGHGSVNIPAVTSNTTTSMDDRADTGLHAYEAENRLNMTRRWFTGPFEVDPGDDVLLAYTGTNTSDSELSSIDTQEQDELEIEILNQVAKKGLALVAGAGLGEELGSAFSEGFNELFADPVGDLIGFSKQGPCNGVVFADALRFSGSELDMLPVQPLAYVDAPRTKAAETISYIGPGVRVTRNNTDAATHDSQLCGHVAETDVTFVILRVPYVSVRDLMARRFETRVWSAPIRAARKSGGDFSLKWLLGVRP